LKVTFLGTGTSQGVPVIGCKCPVCRSLDFRDKRLRSSIHIQLDNQNIVIDTGPDFRQQMLRENIDRLDAILFTHAHRDHTAGLDDVRAYNYLQNMDMPIYATIPTLEQLRLEYSYAFVKQTYPGIPRLDPVVIDEQPFSINGIEIIPLPVLHLKLPVFGYRLKDFSYITDANFISDETLDRLKGTEVLVLNALQRDWHISHFNLEEALKMIEVINPKQTYLTHISHKLGLHKEVLNDLPDNVFLAYDGLNLEV
jgi:phosphoribosyl 1,2-cyclic phosphate phosphodiesterase